MSVLILHLSDLHVEGDLDPVVPRAKAIADVLNPYLPATSVVFIVVSGDIAQAGLKVQYDVATRLLKRIATEIRTQKDLPVEFVTVPGNHDCDFSADQAVRNAILKDLCNYVGRMPTGLINGATTVQENYFNFRNHLISQGSLVHDDRLWSIQEFVVEGKSIWFDSLNASWMSTEKEKPGVVFFPFESYTDFKSSDADLRIAVIHHPFNWFNQINYQDFRGFLHSLNDIVITGHEHTGNAGVRSEARGGECAYIEGCALQVANQTLSAFNLIELRLDSDDFSCEKYQLNNDRYEGTGREPWLPIRSLPLRVGTALHFTVNFQKTLNDPGATLNHPDKKDLKLDDFYVFPDLDLQSDDRKRPNRLGSLAKKRSSKTLTRIDTVEPSFVLEGDENSGKTRLLYQLCKSYHSQNYLPLYVDGRKIKSSNQDDLMKVLSNAIVEQYGAENLTAFEQTTADRKVLLIDDFDQAPLQNKSKERLCEFIATGFRVRILTVGENFGMGELVAAEKLTHLATYLHFKILPFGYERRGELVKKWNRLGLTEVASSDQWLNACSQAEKLIEAARLQHVATTVPIMVLSLLQIGTSGIAKEMHNSSFAHYFYFLIVSALEKSGVSKSSLAKYIGFATHLSWFVKLNGNELEISEDQFRKFCSAYSKEWTTSDPTEMLSTLTSARILDTHGDAIFFTYQYCYYYFLGRYTNSFVGNDDVKEYLAYCMEHLYVRECANTLLFLAHHSDNSFVLDGVTAALSGHFVGTAPVTFSKEDVKAVSSLISNAPGLIYRNKDPVKHREELHKFQDENDSGDDGLSSAPKPNAQQRDFIEEIISVSKTMEIAGVLLSNQFSSLTRDKKNSAIHLVFEAGLKVIRDCYGLIEEDPERLIKELAVRVRSKRKELSSAEAEIQTRHAVAWILKIISTGWVEKAGAHLTSGDLRDNVNDVVEATPTLAMRLIKISQQLSGPGRLPQAALKAIVKDEKDNPCVMSVLQLLILKRLYMYDTHHDDKHWAIGTFQLGGASNPIELSNRQHRFEHRS